MDTSTIVIFILVNVILALVVSVLGNVMTPTVQSFFKKSSLSFNERRIAAILDQYNYIKSIEGNLTLVGLVALRDLAIALGQLTALLLQIGLFTVIPIRENAGLFVFSLLSMAFLSVNVFKSFLAIVDFINNVIRPTVYKTNVKNRIKKLGGNADEIK